MTVLGIDYGSAHKGLALGYTETKLAMPLAAYDHLSDPDFLTKIRDTISEHQVKLIVVGWPVTWPEDRHYRGMREEAEKFADRVSSDIDLPVELVDERYTTAAATRLKKEYPQGDIHALSAMLILQTYLEKQSF